MRNIIVSEFITLDGVVEAPDKWSLAFWNDDIAQFKFSELFASDGLLLGRVTYQGFAAAWPSQTDEQGYADRMNTFPKAVVSTTLTAPEWNNTTVIAHNVADEVAKLKQQPGQDLLVFGSATLVQTLAKHDLVDEYRLLVYPVVRGTGHRLFQDDTTAALQLVEAKTFGGTVVALTYRAARDR